MKITINIPKNITEDIELTLNFQDGKASIFEGLPKADINKIGSEVQVVPLSTTPAAPVNGSDVKNVSASFNELNSVI